MGLATTALYHSECPRSNKVSRTLKRSFSRTSLLNRHSQLMFAPESPWHLVRRGRHDEALLALDRLSDRDAVDNRETLSLIQHTVALERQLNMGSSVWDCFRGTDLRRTEIACVVWSSQIWTQFALASGTYFFEVA